MYKENKKCANRQRFPRTIRSHPIEICISWTSWLSLGFLFLFLCSAGAATDFYSGHQYTFNSTFNENYIYQWSASTGNYEENGQDTLAWVAPNVNSPTSVTISLLVIDKTCSCHSNSNTIITVLPLEETKLKTESSSNSTNSTPINDSIKPPQILSNNTGNSTVVIPIENDTILDPASESLENVTAPVNLTLDAVSATDSASLDSSQNDTTTNLDVPENSRELNLAPNEQEINLTTLSQPKSDPNANLDNALAKEQTTTETSSQVDPSQFVADLAEDRVDQSGTTENPSGMESVNKEVDQKGTNIISDASTLTFSDGTKVDVAFVENDPVSSTTFVTLHGDDTEQSEIISGSDDSNNAGSLLNTTSISNSTFNQADNRINQIKPTEAIPKNETNNHSNELASEYSVEGEGASNSTGSLATPADQPIAEVAVSDAVEGSTSPPLPVEAPPDLERETPVVNSTEGPETPSDQSIAEATVSDAVESSTSPP